MLPKGCTDEKQCIILMRMDSEEDNIKLAKFVCQLSKKRENIINRQKTLLDSLSIIITFHTDFLIPICRTQKFPYNNPTLLRRAIRMSMLLESETSERLCQLPDVSEDVFCVSKDIVSLKATFTTGLHKILHIGQ